jgi:hypothetical protein
MPVAPKSVEIEITKLGGSVMQDAIRRKVFAAVAPAVVVLGLGAAIGAQNGGGNIFVSTDNGGSPSGNIFTSSVDAYLNTGSRGNAPCGKDGLADGDYYFQVTDSSGSQLRSSDPLDQRRITVSGGRIVAVSGTHGLASGRCGSRLVQLFPFTTNTTATDFKLWLVPVNRYDPNAGSFGFAPRFSKTHPFTVAGSSGPAQVDSDGDGIIDFYDHCPTVYDPSNTCYSS